VVACNVLRDDGRRNDQVHRALTYLLFLTMTHERETRSLNPERIVIFRKDQKRIQDHGQAQAARVDLIDNENWSATDTDIKGDACEETAVQGCREAHPNAAGALARHLRPGHRAGLTVLLASRDEPLLHPLAPGEASA